MVGRLALRLGDALVRALLGLYPAAFRDRYGEELREAFRVQASTRLRERGVVALPGLWARTAWGMTRGALAERGRGHRNEDEPMSGDGWVGTMLVELRQAARRLRRSPVFTALAVATLGLGAGAFTSVWVVVDDVLLDPLPYEDPDELRWVWRDYTDFFDLARGWLGGPDVAWMAEQDVFAGVTAVLAGRLNLTGRAGLEPREVWVMQTSASFFDVLGVAPAIGRGFVEGEDAPGAPGVVVLTRALWIDQFGGSSDVLGSEIRLDGEPYTVVGILPDDFTFTRATSLGEAGTADLYMPLRMDLAAQSPGSGFLSGLVRVRPEAPEAAVEAALASVADRVDEGWGDGALRLWTVGMKDDLVSDSRSALFAILGAAGFLLLILGANLATLLLARATTGQRDAAVRAALGAGRTDVAATALAEVVLLALGGGAAAALLGAYGAELLAGLAGDAIPRTAEIGMGATGATLAVGVAVAVVLLAAAGPVGRLLAVDPGTALREGGARGGESRGAVRSRGVLVVAQVALSIVLLVGAGLLTRSLAGLLRADPGFDPGATLTARVSLDESGYPDDAAVTGLLDRLEARIAALPGVQAVGVTEALPLGGDASQTTAVFPGAPGNTGDEEADAPLVDFMATTPGYFAAAGLRLLEGRPFPPEGRVGGAPGAPPAVVIDDVLARRFYPTGTPLGRSIVISGDTAQVVGVVDQARLYRVDEDDRGQVYRAMALDASTGLNVVVRAAGDRSDPLVLAGPVRSAVHALDPTLPVSEVRTLDDVVRTALRGERLNLVLVGGFALAALLLAALGVYGVVANAVVRRRPEIGIRMAMGAAGGEVVRLVLGQGLRLVLVGAALGLVGAAVLSRLMESLLYGIEPVDPLTYAAVTGALVGLASLAAWLPARRATRIPPSDALRAE